MEDVDGMDVESSRVEDNASVQKKGLIKIWRTVGEAAAAQRRGKDT
jgi:hypothetical protein